MYDDDDDDDTTMMIDAYRSCLVGDVKLSHVVIVTGLLQFSANHFRIGQRRFAQRLFTNTNILNRERERERERESGVS